MLCQSSAALCIYSNDGQCRVLESILPVGRCGMPEAAVDCKALGCIFCILVGMPPYLGSKQCSCAVLKALLSHSPTHMAEWNVPERVSLSRCDHHAKFYSGK